MKRTKTQRGITLLALVITIVVLLILAGVAINSITSTNLIDQAATAGQAWNNAQTNESTILGEYESKIDAWLGSDSGEKIKEEYSTLAEGTKVKYDSNGDGKLEEWIVLNNTSGKLEIVSSKVMGSLILGYQDTSVTVTSDLDGDGTVGDEGDKALVSYNNVIKRINDYCKELVTATNNSGVRSIGASEDKAGNYTSEKFEMKVNAKAGDENYLNDYTKLSNLGILKTGSPYWIASRYVTEVSNDNMVGAYFNIRGIDVNGELSDVDIGAAGVISNVFSFEAKMEIEPIDYIGVRPVVINPTELYY